jgi:hypothetical protein
VWKKEEREIAQLQNKIGAPAREASEGSVKRIIEKVDADAGHAKVTEGLNMRYAADEFALEWREGINFLGNFQAKLKLDSFAKLEAGRKIGAALGNVHGLRMMWLSRALHGEHDLQLDALDKPCR